MARGVARVFTNRMKFITVFEAASEAEALMYQEMLKQEGIAARISLPSTQQFIRANYGGASMPFDIWEIAVAEQDAVQAKTILPDQPHYTYKPVTGKARWFVMFILTSIGLGLLAALKEMINYFTNS